MLIWVLLAVLFWAVVPGLITGWMRRERGRSFFPGLLIGLVFGPFGILATLAFIYFAERRDARRRRPRHGRAVRVFYDIPVVGRLHVSTVWALAGLATFLCLWMIGGIGYEFYRTNLLPEDSDGGPQAAAVREKKTSDANSSAVAPSADSKLNSPAQSNNSAQTRAALLGNISTQPGQPATSASHSENSSAQTGQTTSSDAGNPVSLVSQPGASATVPAPSPPVPAASAAPARAPAQSREAAVAEVTQLLNASGHRVHASLSGDAQTTTLSLSGATLTREAGNQLLGNRRLRETLKAAGVRIVVMVNGQESWTYML